jgi:hypothetical protein
MEFILNTSRKERVKKKIEAKRLADMADWSKLIENYLSAYELGIKRLSERQNQDV